MAIAADIVVKAGQTALNLLTGLFKSKKHYHLYYWDTVQSVWVFVMDGHPSNVKPQAAALQKSGVVVAIVRNKGDKNADGSLAPKSPPAGYKAADGSGAGLSPWILVGIAGAGLLAFVLLKKRR
jgi:hypothetical protein